VIDLTGYDTDNTEEQVEDKALRDDRKIEDIPIRIVELQTRLTQAMTRLPVADHELLLKKGELLAVWSPQIPAAFRKHKSIIDATLVFGQEAAGTAVCISSIGLLLTCAHCVAEDEDELDWSRVHWLVFRSGKVVKAVCIAWDSRRDLALLRVIAAQDDSKRQSWTGATGPTSPNQMAEATRLFPYIHIARSSPSRGSNIVCIGHPGSEDLEADEPGMQTGYEVLHLSQGLFHGHEQGQDLQDNSEIGALKHDAWTYWGHSGAPLIDRHNGELIGLHSSWDDETGMRRGVALEAIGDFLKIHLPPDAKQAF